MTQSFLVEGSWNQWFQRILSAPEDPEKIFFSRMFDQKITETKVVWNSVEACEGYKPTEKFDKVCSQYLKTILTWLLSNVR